MSAVDSPPGIAFAGQAAGEFVARPRARRLARRVFIFVTFVAGATLFVAARRPYVPSAQFMWVAPMMCWSVAVVGYSVRSARLRFDSGGVRWGWSWGGFRMVAERITAVRGYSDAFALKPKRGSIWYLSRRDWYRFEDVPAALRRANIPFETFDRRAPFTAKIQSYGVVLDTMLVLDSFAAVFALVGTLLA